MPMLARRSSGPQLSKPVPVRAVIVQKAACVLVGITASARVAPVSPRFRARTVIRPRKAVQTAERIHLPFAATAAGPVEVVGMCSSGPLSEPSSITISPCVVSCVEFLVVVDKEHQ